MGRKRFNLKGRKNPETIIDNSTAKQIRVEFVENKYGEYDEANALVLPSKKRVSKIKREKQSVTRILSKKQRRNLEKIADKKQKKEGRTSLLMALASVQIPAQELKSYTSFSAIQTAGLKNIEKIIKNNRKSGKNDSDNATETEKRVSSIAGGKRKCRLALLSRYGDAESSDAGATLRKPKRRKDANVIGMEFSSSSSDESGAEGNEDFEENDNEAGYVEEEKSETIAGNEIDNNNSSESALPQLQTKQGQASGEGKPVEALTKIKTVRVKPAVYVHVERDIEMQKARLKLPILAEEQIIMETINENQFIILAGETGSGKTTQVPQFLYEAGYAEKKLIGVTEPRRVAAISMSKRVAKEMNLSEKEVSYLIRFEGNVTDKTKIKFMTDGVLLKEIESDFMLNKYSVIILDEAHERSSYTDILIGLLSRIVPLRNKKGTPLKLIIMSATLKVEDFTSNVKLFTMPPPVIKVEARQFPVTVHFQKRTPDEYVKEAYRKALKIHSKLPEGGILIFVTGQQEVRYLVRKLRKAFPYKGAKERHSESIKSKHHELENEDEVEFDMKRAIKNSKKARKKLATQISLPHIDLDNYKLPTEDTDVDLLEDAYADHLDGTHDLDSSTDDSESETNFQITKQPLWVLPLYSLLSTEKQSRVFEPPPDTCRLCVVSTNVAETSLTIPNIKYVVDSGRQKTRVYDKVTGVSAFVVTFTSKASADQRAGRAGRLSAGHCYRLYSSAVYNDEFEDFAVPDIQKKPVDHLMLQMKCMRIDKVVNFPFPSPPDCIQLTAAEKRLKLLGALEDCSDTGVAKVTPLGYAISAFPVAPRFGKMLALSHQKDLLAFTVCTVAALSVQEVLLEVVADEPAPEADGAKKSVWYNKRLSWAGRGHSQLLGDPMVLLRAVGASEYAGSRGNLLKFCEENGLRSKAIAEIRKLRVQLTNEINLSLANVNLSVDPKMQPPTDLEAKFLRQILLAGMGDQVARKIPNDELKDKEAKRKFKYAYQCPEMEEPVFMHSASVLKRKLPEWVIYQEVYELQNGDATKMFMRGITAIEPEWLLIYVKKLCNILGIKEDPIPKYNNRDGSVYAYVEATFGRSGWPLPLTQIVMPTSEKSCRYFGMFLLNGDVFPILCKYKNKLKSSPTSVIKSWSNLNANLTAFLKVLTAMLIDSKQKILDAWKVDANYLLQQYADLLIDIDCAEVATFWPPIKDV